MAEILTSDHELFVEFIERLEAQVNASGCDHSTKKAAKILLDMGFDVEGSLATFEEEGGYCDCEIIFNVGN